MKKIKKALALILTLLVVISALPMSTFAAGETLSLSVQDYTPGDSWEDTVPKPINLNVTVPTVAVGEEYKIKITLPAGMRFNSFIWNKDWGGAKPSTVEGVAVNMTEGEKILLVDNSVSFDDNGTPMDKSDDITTLTYTIANTTTAVNLSGKIMVEPKIYYVYDGDIIPDGVKVELLDYTDTVVETESVDITAEAASARKFALGWYGRNVVAPGDTDIELTSAAGVLVNRYHFATDLKMVIPMPDCVTDITRVRFQSGVESTKDNLTFSYDYPTRTLTVESPGDGRLNWDIKIWGNIDPLATIGIHDGASDISTSFTYYDGTVVTDRASNSYTRYSTIWLTTPNADIEYSISAPGANMNSRANAQPESEDVSVFLHRTENFKTVSALTTDQIIEYDFNDDVEIRGIHFPIDEASSFKDVDIVFDDGTTRTYPTLVNDGNYISMYLLKKEDSTIPDSAKSIKSISVNCGTFRAGYQLYSGSGEILVGRYSEDLVAAGVDKDFTYELRINGTPNTLNMYYRPTPGNTNDNYRLGALFTNIAEGGTQTLVAGSTAKMRTTIQPYTTGLSSIYEPEMYIIVPDYFSIDTSTIYARQASYAGTLNVSYETISNDELSITPMTVTDGVDSYSAYKVVAPNTVITYYNADGEKCRKDIHFYYDLKTDEQLPAGPYNIGRYLYGAKENDFFGAGTTYVGEDIFDVNGNGVRDNPYEVQRFNYNLNILENKNVTVSGYLSNQMNDTVGLPAYNPGANGSTDVNAVTFKPGDTAYYNVLVRNTLDTDTSPAQVKAYVPIPKAEVSSGIPLNIDNSYTHYQFNDFKWPMNLSRAVTNPDSSIFDIEYYTGDIVLDQNGNPVNTPAFVNPSSLTASQAADVTLIAIVTKAGETIPAVTGGTVYEKRFEIPLEIGVNETEAVTSNLNNTKNIFRPYFWRSSDAGAGYSDANYVAAKLSIGRIAGYAFTDKGNNGIYSVVDGDSKLSGVTVKLFTKSEWTANGIAGTPEETTVTAGDGSYGFNGLSDGNYVVVFENPAADTIDSTNANARHFTKNISYDALGKYQIDSDAVASSDHSIGTVEVSIPKTAMQSSYHNDYICAGFAPPLDITIKNEDDNKGTITNPSADDTTGEVVNIWSGETITEPTTTANSGYTFKQWEKNGVSYAFTTPLTENSTIIGVWQGLPMALTLDANGNAGDATFPTSGQTTLTGITVNTGEKISNGINEIGYEEPVRTGYTFAGWYLEDTCTTAIGNTIMPNTGKTIYAKWTANDVVASFDPQGGNVTATGANGTVARTGKVGELLSSVSDTPPALTPPIGYELDGWYTAVSGGGTKLTSSSVFPSTPQTYYANWKAIEATDAVKFDLKGGNIAGDTSDILWDGKYGETLASIAASNSDSIPVDPVKAGYIFAGWKRVPGSGVYQGTELATQKLVVPLKSTAPYIIYEAQWTEGDSKINFNANTGASDVTYTQKLGSVMPVSSVVKPVLTGHTFKGWTETQYAVGTLPINNTEYLTGSVTFDDITVAGKTYYAVWEKSTYTVTLNANGGTIGGNATNQITGISYNSAVNTGSGTVSDPVAPSSGFTFIKWVDVDDPLNEYSSLQLNALLITENKAFIAKWSGVNHTVTFTQGVNGTLATNPSVYSIPDGIKPASPEVTANTGWVFSGWKVVSNTGDATLGANVGDVLTVSDLYALSVKGDLEFEAIYTRQKIAVQFDLNGGTQTIGELTALNQSINYGTVPKAPTGTKLGYTLSGWLNVQTNTVVASANINTTTLTENTTYVAQWTVSSKTVSFYDNHGANLVNNVTVQEGAVIDVDTYYPQANQAGYTFLGWADAQAVTSPNVIGNQTILDDEDYYAVWTNQNHVVTFMQHDGITAISSMTIAEGLTVYNADGSKGFSSEPTPLVQTGKTFVGWRKNTETAYRDFSLVGADVVMKETVYTAVYTQTPVKVSFDAQGGSFATGVGSPFVVNLNQGDSINVDTVAPPTYANKTFLGWASTSGALTSDISGSKTINADVTYYAVWKSNTHKVSFLKADGTTEIVPAKNIVHGNTVGNITDGYTSEPLYTLSAGESLLGWKLVPQTTSQAWGTVSGLSVTSDMIFVAVVQSDKHTLSFDVNVANGGSGIAPSSVIKDYGTIYAITETATSSSSSDEFIGWYDAPVGGNIITAWNFQSDKTVYAQYAPKAVYTVNFVFGANGAQTAGDMIPAVQNVVSGSTALVPQVTANTDWQFNGWTMNGGDTKYSSADVATLAITSNTTFTADYFSTAGGGSIGGGGGGGSSYFTLAFDSNGGSAVKPISDVEGAIIDLTPYSPTKKGDTFIGWYSESTFINKVTKVTLNENKIVYAKWENSSIGIGDLITDDHISYINGYSDGTFRADDSITRAEVATIFYRLLKDNTAGGNKEFTDIKGNEWYAKAVNKLGGLGIINGYQDGSFKPYQKITRAEFTAMAARFTGTTGTGIDFTDVSKNHWAYDAISAAVDEGWINGYSDKTFKPDNDITRAESVTIVNRMLTRIPDKKFIDSDADVKTFKDIDKTHWAFYEIIEASNHHDYNLDINGNETWTNII